MMNTLKLTITLLLTLMTFGCSPAAETPTIQASPMQVTATATTPPTPSVTVVPSATLDPDFPQGCISPAEIPLDTSKLNGRFVVLDSDWPDFYSYFLDPKSNQL